MVAVTHPCRHHWSANRKVLRFAQDDVRGRVHRRSIQQAIAAVEGLSPGTWQRMVDIYLGKYDDKPTKVQHEAAQSCVHPMIIAFHDLPFVRDSADPYATKHKLIQAAWNAAGEEASKQRGR